MSAEIHQMRTKPATINWMCSACGVDAGCNCGAPLMSKGQRAAEAVAAAPRKSNVMIAEEIGVSPETVRRARPTSTYVEVEEESRLGRDGKVRRLPERSEDEPTTAKEAIKDAKARFLNIALEAIEDAKFCSTCDLSVVLKDKKIIQAVDAAAAAWSQLAAKLKGNV